ncbi:MAG: M28 family peptidase [Planctomycetota bacterium]
METINARKAYNFLKALSFERRSGSAEERKASGIIAGFLREMGLRPKIEKFNVDIFSLSKAALEITGPFRKKIKAWPIGYSKSTPAKGINAPLVYVDNPNPSTLARQKGNIVILSSGFGAKNYEALVKSGAKVLIRICPPGKDSYNKFLYYATKKHGRIPGVSIGYEDGLEILKRKAARCRIRSSASVKQSASQNVITEIKGTKHPDEIILVGAHYDSVPWSGGAIDNAAGSALALALAAKYAKNPLHRTLRFVWFGCEELGLIGSFTYVGRHAKELKKIKLNLNLDVGGNIVGRIVPRITGSDELKTCVEVMGKETGAFSSVLQIVASSDSAPFAEKGIEALNLSRRGGGADLIHTEGDRLEHCGPQAFDSIGGFAALFLERVGNAVEFPFTGGLPPKLKKSLKEHVEMRGRKFEYRENR